MATFFQECISAFSAFGTWLFSTSSGLGVTIGGLIVAINVMYIIGHYLLDRFK